MALLVHGNRSNITVDTLDSAGNPAQRAGQYLDVSLYPADIPTVFVTQNNSYTPTLGGLAQKLGTDANGAGLALESGDTLTVVIRAGSTDVVSYTLVMGSVANSSAGPLSYDTATKQWKLDLASAPATDARVTSDGVYDVAVSVLPKGFVANAENTKTDQSSGEWVVKAAAPVLTWGTTLAGDNRINASEAQSGVLLSGTVTDAMPGNGTNAAAGRSVTLGLTGLAADHPLAGKTWTTTVQANGGWSATIPAADLQQLGAGMGVSAHFHEHKLPGDGLAFTKVGDVNDVDQLAQLLGAKAERGLIAL